MNKFKKILSATLAVIMLLGCCAFTVSAEDEQLTADTKWYNTETQQSKQAILTTPAELLGLSTLVDTGGAEATNLFAGWTIKLGNDIVYNTGEASMWDTTKPTNTWTPIASFKGTFDGQGHVISGLYFNQDNATNIGLFGMTDGATIKNVSVVNSYFKGRAGIGAIVGSATGLPSTISNCYTDAYLVSYTQGVDRSCVGGILGVAGAQTTVDEVVTGCVVENCWFDGDIYCYDQDPNASWKQNATRVGGIVGSSELVSGKPYNPMTIRNCLVTGDIEAQHHMGGIAGSIRNDAAPSVIENCLMLGTMKATRGSDGIASGMFAATTSAGITVTMTNVYGLDTFSLVHERCDGKASGIKFYGWETAVFGNDGDANLNVTLKNGDTTKTFPGAFVTTDATEENKNAVDEFNTFGKVTAASITGDTAKTTLAGFDFNNTWATVANGTPVLKALAYVAKYQSSAPVYVGYQATENNNGEYKTRFIAVVDDYNLYDEIGFDITIGDKTVTFNCWNVYDSITADYGLKNYSASELGGKHIVALVLTGMSENVDVTVTPWVKYKNADTVAKGESASFTVTPPQSEIKKN